MRTVSSFSKTNFGMPCRCCQPITQHYVILPSLSCSLTPLSSLLYNFYINFIDNKAPRSTTMPEVDLLGGMGGEGNDSASVPPGAYAPAPMGDLLGDAGTGALVPAVNPNAAYPGAPPAQAANTAQPAFYPSSPQRVSQQQPLYPPATPPAYGAAPAPMAYPGQQQQYQQQQQPQYPAQAPAPGFAQPPQAGYPYHQQQQPQMQQQAAGGYPAASYPVPTQQF